MAQNSCDSRILAIAIRSQRLGFAVTEGSMELVHWGMIFYEGNEKAGIAAAAKQVESLIARFVPYRVAIERSNTNRVPNPSNLHSLYRCIHQEAYGRYVPVSLLTRIEVREAFRSFGVRAKDQIATLLARMFPELQPRLPPKRKLWKREHFSMPLFDAVALAVAHWQRDCFRE